MHRPAHAHRLVVAEQSVERGSAAIERLRAVVADGQRHGRPVDRPARMLRTFEELQAALVAACERTWQVVGDDSRR
ncbi:MAG: hypothetical protein JO055_10500 [Alphaproteobacteria bacterium]|nr:hypothetical protein [Alphaproteobacteria bacterium]